MRWYIAFGFLAGLVGCGSVDGQMSKDAGAGGAGGATGEAIDGGKDVVSAGGAAGAVATGGVGGAAGRPLGAGCASDDQCGSGICTTSASGQTCCDGRSTVCTSCVGGYQTAMPDGTQCGTPTCDSTSTVATNYACTAGACQAMIGCCTFSECAVLDNKTAAICDSSGADHGDACPSSQCVIKPGQRGCASP